MNEEETSSMCRILFGGGLTINPDGRILLCCVSTTKELAHISEIDNLHSFFNSSLINEIRNTMKSGSLPEPWCNYCIKKRKEGETAPIDDWVQNIDPPSRFRKEHDPFDIQFLEFAPSNICNQNCAMCGSVYSSKWAEWDNELLENGFTFRFKDKGQYLSLIHI